MNKIAHYLNTHMLGEVVTNPNVRKAYAHDASALSQIPEMVAYPRATSDIRKVARFSWQLAEKGHTLPLIARGAGTDVSGAAIGKGMLIVFPAHMNRIYEYDVKQRLVRLQPGVSVGALSNALALQGTAIPELHWEHDDATIGGVVASSRASIGFVDQLEVVLSSGDILQTKRVSKRELSKVKAKPGLEGDIYREIDALIDENKDLIDNLVPNDDRLDHEGYSGIELVKNKDGSLDLAPLFVGMQGTLGVISEMILKASVVNRTPAVMAASFASREQAQDAIDVIEGIDPSYLEYVDGAYLEAAQKAGKTFGFYAQANDSLGMIAATLVITFNDYSERARNKKMKKAEKLLKEFSPHIVQTNDFENSDLRSLGSITYWALNPDDSELSAPPLLDGMYVSLDRFDDFARSLTELSQKHHVELALYGRPLDELWYVRPILRIGTVGDKQKLLKLSKDLMAVVERHGGAPFGASGEGRIGASLKDQDAEIAALYKKIKNIFDPHGLLNPGVKQPSDVRELAKQLKNTYVAPAATGHVTKF